MRTTIQVCLLLAALFAGRAMGNDTMTAIDGHMQRYAGDGPGAALLVVRDGEALVRRGYGLGDLEARTAVTPATRFRLASVSKQFTATAVLLLVDDGVLRLEDPVRRWLPSLPMYADGVTLHHLLAHTGGLPDYEDLMAADFSGQVHDADVVCLLASGLPCDAAAGTPSAAAIAPYFAPGSAYRYSNTGYALLARVVEMASDGRYADFLQARIFAPLGMDGAVAFEDGVSQVAHRAYGHSAAADGWQRTDQSTTSAVLGDGGIYASIDDLTRWAAALDDGRLLSPASRARMVAAQTSTPTGEADVDAFGYGWRLHGDLMWHSGETIGFRNVILHWPRQRLTVVLLSNRNDPEPYATARAIAALFLAP
ncbi:beta-lactamase family protein [Luteimonas sp. MC1572]|nr:beta-lactamase family protein [Luteimonas sp. MC1572]QQO03278.1 beta-lactamase family protein [Luteimonas sp. MC1572]